jgi:4-amino-4-deoxy-L-arabinose transferase-like glycosyltransferase
MNPTRSTKAHAFIVCLPALALRAYWAIRGYQESAPFLRQFPISEDVYDPADYIRLARNIRFHHVFSFSQGAEIIPSYFRAPLYPTLIASLWWGDDPPLIAVLVVQVLLGTLTVWLTYLLARKFFDRKVALVAGIGMALAPMTGVTTGAFMSETLFTFLLILGIYQWAKERYVLTGFLFGLASLTRPTMLPFFGSLLLVSLMWKSKRKHFLVICLVGFLMAGVWTLRNAIVFGRFIPVQSAGSGTNLLLGTLEIPYGGNPWTRIAEHPAYQTGMRYEEPAVEDIFRQRAVERIKSRPFHWILLRLYQYPRLFMDSGQYVVEGVFIKMAFLAGNFLLVVLAFMGAWTERRRFTELWPLLSFPIFLILFQAVVWCEGRYSLPIMPMFAIFAARSIDAWASASKAR